MVEGESHCILLLLLLLIQPFFIFINVTKCTNQFKYIFYADDSTLSTCNNTIIHFIETRLQYNWHNNKNGDGLVNRLVIKPIA